jgi:hypothetical protein
MSLQWDLLLQLQHLKKQLILGEQIEFLEVLHEVQQLQLLHDLLLLHFEQILEDQLDNLQVFVE